MVRFPRVRAWLEQLLHTHDTPERTAGAFALGVFLGFSPFLGLHTVLGLILAFGLNLNRLAVLVGVYSNLPWILVPYYSVTTWLAAAAMGLELPDGLIEAVVVSVEHRSWPAFRASLAMLKPFLWAFTLGSMLGAAVLALVSYRAALAMILSHRRHQQRPQGSEQ